MTPSERLRLRMVLADVLSKEGWTTVQETFYEFNVFIDEHFNGTLDEYILAMTRAVSDEVLLQLAEHLGLSTSLVQGTRDSAEDLWKRPGLRAFISHVSSQRALCADISELLARGGVRCFVAHDAIEPDEEWQRHIERALRTADCLVALLTDEFPSSRWTDQEVGFAHGLGLPITAVRLPLDPYGFIGKRQGLSVKIRDARSIAVALHKNLAKKDGFASKMALGMLSALAESKSFEHSNRIAKAIRNFGVWETAFNEILLAAMKDNVDVRGAWGVKGCLKEFVEESGGTWPDHV